MHNQEYEYRQGEEHAAHGSFAAGLLFGALAGAAAALLLAPRTGREMRGQLANSADDFKRRAHDGYEQVKQTYDRARDGFRRAGDAVSDATGRAEAFVDDVKSSVNERSTEKVQSWT
jgi:gas vesicle protein